MRQADSTRHLMRLSTNCSKKLLRLDASQVRTPTSLYATSPS